LETCRRHNQNEQALHHQKLKTEQLKNEEQIQELKKQLTVKETENKALAAVIKDLEELGS
jgi:nucleosome binding factor SPN SPT16 subunit